MEGVAPNMEEEEMDVASLMGFSSFGRKRKHGQDAIPSRPAHPQTADPATDAPSPLPAPPSLPAKPPPASHAPVAAVPAPAQRKWWVGYYDPTTNENPWEILEKKGNLEPLGSWLPRGHARQDRQPGRGVQDAEAAGDSGTTEGGE